MKTITPLFVLSVVLFISACGGHQESAEDATEKAVTPVTITAVYHAPISETFTLNAVSLYQKKNSVRSTVTGYIQKAMVNIGDYVQTGQALYSIVTKEAEALRKYAAKDTLFKIRGDITIYAPSTGIITDLQKLSNDYVSDGDVLCTIADQSSFVFQLNVPFELNAYTAPGRSCQIRLPDQTRINGTITARLSTVDPASQTQSYIIKAPTNSRLPENLNVWVEISKQTKSAAQVVTKSSVLANETMDHFWVMKLINDSTAVKVSIEKGIANDSLVEILRPSFAPSDRIIKTGSYGLQDTASVSITKE